MDANLINWLVGIAVITTAICLFAAAISYIDRKNDFERKANKIRLDKMKAEAELDLKLREWQQTKSLEDLARHRERLERSLDDMHDANEGNEVPGNSGHGKRVRREEWRRTSVDDQALRMLGGANLGPNAKLTLPSGRELAADEAQAFTSAFSDEPRYEERPPDN